MPAFTLQSLDAFSKPEDPEVMQVKTTSGAIGENGSGACPVRPSFLSVSQSLSSALLSCFGLRSASCNCTALRKL